MVGLHNLTSLILHEVSYTAPEFIAGLTLEFSPTDGTLVKGQNTGLKQLVLDFGHGVTDARWSDPEAYDMCMKAFFVAVVGMVLSRTKSVSQIAIDSGAVNSLEYFGVGPHFAQVYRTGMESEWDEVRRGWEELDGLVRFVERDTGCGCF